MYEKRKKGLLEDQHICKPNRKLFNEFFTFQEYKLKRINNLRALDEGTYKTLCGYITKFRAVNVWFKNKSWRDLTKKDVKHVYDDLEDGVIKKQNGKPFENLEDSYYSKIFKSKPFEIAGKIDIARDVISYSTKQKKDVRFIQEDGFRKLVSNAYKPHHRLLLWLAWDIGENINSLLKLNKSDITKQTNPHTKEPEYRINLKQGILKRSRKPRSEITNFKETVELLDQELPKIEGEKLFNFEYPNAKKIINRLVERIDIKCIPNGERVTWKDLRSGMACDLLKKGWSTDEINARLGHKPSSDEIDKYVDFLAIDRHTPKKKLHDNEVLMLHEKIKDMEDREKLQSVRMDGIMKKLAYIDKFERLVEAGKIKS